MRSAVMLVLVTAGCAAPPALRPGGDAHVSADPAPWRDTEDTLQRLERLRLRRTWPSETDRGRWLLALDSADRARAGLAHEPPVRSPDLVPAVDALDQMDALFRVGETARTRR